MASVNPNTIPETKLKKVIKGLEAVIPDYLESIGTKQTTATMSGTAMIMGSSELIPRLSADDAIGIAPLAEHSSLDMDIDEWSYKCLRYGDKAMVSDHYAADLKSVSGIGALENMLQKAIRRTKAKKNRKLQSLLSSVTLNETVAAGTAWSDDASSPIDNLNAIEVKIGEFDTLFMGKDIKRALMQHPDFLAHTSNFAAGAVGEGVIVAFLRGLYPHIKKVIIGSAMYNDENRGVGYNLSYNFDGLLWAGYESGIQYVRNTATNTTEQLREPGKKATTVFYEECFDVQRPALLKDLGCVLTSVI